MEERVTDLEVRLAFLEKNLEELDGVVRHLGDALDNLREEVTGMRKAMDRSIEATKDLGEDRPPHW